MKEKILLQTKTQKGVEVDLKVDLRRFADYEKIAEFKNPDTGETVRVRLDHWLDEKGAVIGHGTINGKHLRVGVAISLTDWEVFEEKCREIKHAHVEQALKLKPVAFVYQLGCDAPSTWEFDYEGNDLPRKAVEKRIRQDRRLIKVARKLDLDKLGEEYGAQELESTGTTYYGLRFEGQAFDRLMADLKRGEADILERKEKERAARQAADLEREEAKKEFEVSVIRVSRKAGGEGGPDPYADVVITDPLTGQSGEFTCRNIFDFGYVVNPKSGGLALSLESLTKGMDEKEKKQFMVDHPTETGYLWDLPGDGWRAMTEFDIRAVAYLSRFSPIVRDIRM